MKWESERRYVWNPIGPHVQALIASGLYATWSADLRAAMDGRYGAFQWGIDSSDYGVPLEFKDFVEEHARDWTAMRAAAG